MYLNSDMSKDGATTIGFNLARIHSSQSESLEETQSPVNITESAPKRQADTTANQDAPMERLG